MKKFTLLLLPVLFSCSSIFAQTGSQSGGSITNPTAIAHAVFKSNTGLIFDSEPEPNNTSASEGDKIYDATVTTASPLVTPVITASGPTTFCAGGSVTLSVNGDAMQFDGMDDYVETGANITDLTYASFTIEAWIKTTAAGCGMVNCANDDQIWDIGEKVFYLDLSGQPAFVGWGNGYILSNLAVNDGNWHHVAVVWDYSNGSGKIYVDGTDRTSYSGYVTNQSNLGTFKIGRPNFGGMEAPDYFAGAMDELRIWNTPRTQTELQTGMYQSLPANSIGLVAYYMFDEGSGTTTADETTNSFTGTLVNGPSWMVPSTSPVPSYTAYLWSTGDTTASITVSTSGAYSVNVTSINGNTATSAATPVSVIPIPPPVIAASNSTSLCAGDSVRLTAYGGTNGLTFNGLNQYVDVPAFSPGADRTLEFWINFTSPGDGIVMSFAGDLNNAIDLATYQGCIAYHEWDGANYPGVITTPINDGLWHHIAIVRTSAPADNLTIYVDGVSNVTGTASLNTTTNAFSIGAEHWNGSVIRYLGPGSLDEVRIWNIARTGAEIAAGMHGTVPANSAGLEACYKFDEVMGTSTADATGNGHNGTLVNEPARAIPSGAPISAFSSYQWSNGDTTSSTLVMESGTYSVTATTNAGCSGTSQASETVTVLPLSQPVIVANGPTTFICGDSLTLHATGGGNALQFGATGGYVTVPASPDFEFTDGTVELWIKPTYDNLWYYPTLVSNRSSSGTRYSYHLNPDRNGLAFYNGSYAVIWSCSFAQNTWYHIAFVQSGDHTECFVNGNSIGTNISVSSGITGLPLNIGDTQANEVFIGAMDEVRIWNVARTGAQIRESMNTTVQPGSPGLAACYKLDESTGATASDASLNGHHGTLVNAPQWIVPSDAPVADYPAYLWSTGDTTASITVTAGGTYTVTATNSNGCQGAGAPVIVTVNPVQPPVIVANKPTAFCAGDSVILTARGNNNSLILNGMGQYVNLQPFSPAPDRTIEFWISFTNAGDGAILSFAGNTDNAIDVLTDQGGIRYNEYDGNMNVGINTTPINDGTWHHVAIVRTSAPVSNVTIYVDGVSNATGTVTFNTSTNALSIGAQNWYDFIYRHLTASLDEFRIWNVARTNSEIVAGMHGSVPVNSVGLAAYYKFNEGSGNSAADATGHGFNGTLMNSPAWAVPSTAPISGYLTHLWSNGSTTPGITVTEGGNYSVMVTASAGCSAASDTTIVTVTPPLATPVITASGPTSFCSGGSVTLSANGDAMQFDGIDDYVETGADITNLATANFTIEAWIKTTSSGCGIVTCGNEDQSWWPGEKAFYLDLSGHPAFVGWGNNYILSNQAVNDGNWHHVAVVWNYFVSTGKIYIDGTDRTETSGYVANQTNFGSFKIGQSNYSPLEAPNYFAGEMDELRIWNTARTQTELQAEMNQPVAVNSSGLVAYYKFDEGSGTTIADATSHGFTGTLVNGPSWMVPSTSPVPSHIAYLWSNGATTPSITVTSGGMYTVSGSGISGCTKTSAPVAVAVNPLPAPVITADRLTGLCTGSPVTLTTYGGSNALHLNGISQYVDMQPYSPAPDRTIEFWISFTSAGDGVVLSFAGSTNNAIDVLTGQGCIIYNEYDGNSNVGVITTPVNDGTWHHIAIVRTSAGTGNVTIYVDGIANATGTVSLNTTTNALSIGAQKWFNITKRYLGPASLDEFRIWDVARTEAEILAGMHDNVPVSSAGLAVYYKFDEVVGTTAANATGNGNNGTLMNGAEWILPSTAPISSFSSYLWSNGSTNSTITVTTAGDYTVTATTAAGCTATSAATTLTFTPLPPPAITTSGPTTFCSGGSVTLSSNGNAMHFGGTGNYIGTGADITNLTNADFTIEAWIKTTSFDCGIVNCANENEAWEPGEKAFYLDYLGQPAFVGYGNGYILSNLAVNDGNWHHVAVVWDYSGSGYAGTGKIYIDGTDRTFYSDYIANNSNLGSFSIGKPNYGEAPAYFNGSMDELRIWNKAKTQTDLLSAMNQPVPTYSNGLKAYYKFDEGSGTTTADATTHGFTGTLVNGPSWIVPSTSPVPSFLAYSWSNGNTTPGITATTSGAYALTVTNADGCSAMASQAVTVNLFPGAAGTITGPTATAQGHTGITYSVAPVANATGYVWNLPPGAMIVSGANTNSITVNFSPVAESGTISAYGFNDCGNGLLSPELTVTVLPENYNPGSTVVPAGTVRCYNALQTITIAGSGSTFLVQNGGSATMIAGHNIIYRPGTRVEHGGYMRGYITSNNQFCGGMMPAMVTVLSVEEPGPQAPSSLTFRVYPNPTTGIFTIEPGGDAPFGKVRVEVFNMNGIRVLSAEMPEKKKQMFSVSSMPSGLYFIHIISGDTAETVKLIKM